MSRRSPVDVQLSDARAGRPRGMGFLADCTSFPGVRARIVLLAAGGAQNVDIARRVGVCVDVASRWRKRFCLEGLAGLDDRPRSGRPRIFGSEVVAGVKALACEPPEESGVPLSEVELEELASHAVTEGLVDAISSSTVRRWLHADAIKPWRYRSWHLSPRPRLRHQGSSGPRPVRSGL